jgi:hypothetical protein
MTVYRGLTTESWSSLEADIPLLSLELEPARVFFVLQLRYKATLAECSKAKHVCKPQKSRQKSLQKSGLLNGKRICSHDIATRSDPVALFHSFGNKLDTCLGGHEAQSSVKLRIRRWMVSCSTPYRMVHW